MQNPFAGPFPVALLALLVVASAGAQQVFKDGFETPCDSNDVDGDRLTGCDEVLAQTDPSIADTDGDGLSDGDEVLGTLGGLDLPALGVDPRRKDILLEYDWFDDSSEQGSTPQCPPGVHSHRPTQEMLDIVTVMYGAAPVANPNGQPGINVIHDFGQGGPFVGGSLVQDVDGDGTVQGDVLDDDYNAHYASDFAQNRVGYFHYVLMPHRWKQLFSGIDTYSGVAEITPGTLRDEMIVSLYCEKTTRNVGFVIAHELGHNLGLRHGGDSKCNGKPNYRSIMNYRFSFAGVDVDCDGDVNAGPADFSQGVSMPLDEANLDESKGLCGAPIDWNGINGIEPSVQRDLNPYPEQVADCGAVFSVLTDFNDWAAVDLRMVPAGGGNGPPVEVLTPCPGPAQEP